MKKIIVSFLLLISISLSAQINADKVDGLIFNKPYTTAYLESLTNPPVFLLVRNTDLNALVYYNGTAFVPLGGSGTQTYTASTDLSLTGNQFGLSAGTLDRITANDAKMSYTGVTGNEAAFNGWDKDSTNDIVKGSNLINLNYSVGYNNGGGLAVFPSAQITELSGGLTNTTKSILRMFPNGASINLTKTGGGVTDYIFDDNYTLNNNVARKKDVDAAIAGISTGGASFSLVDDLTPRLGADLDGGGNDITNVFGIDWSTVLNAGTAGFIRFSGGQADLQRTEIHDGNNKFTIRFEDRLTTSTNFSLGAEFEYDFVDERLEINDSPIITAANAAANGIGLSTPQNLTLTGNTLGITGGNTVTLPAGGGSGTVTKVGTPLQQQIGVWTGDGTLGGSENFKFNGNTQIINSPASDKLRLTGSANPRIDLWGNGFAGLVIAKDDGARRVTYETNGYNGTDETWDLVFNEFGGRIQRWNTNAITSLKPHIFSAGATVTGNVTATGNFVGNGSQLTNIVVPDNSITSPKIVNGTILEADLAPAVVTKLNATGAASTGFHNNITLNANTTLAYANQVNGSGYRIDNLLKTGTDIDLTIPNLRAQQNENYKISSLGGSADILPEPGVTFVGKDKGSNDAIRVSDFGGISIFETDVNGTFKVEGDYTWITTAPPASANLYVSNDAAQPTPNETNVIGTVWVINSLETYETSTTASNGARSIRIIDNAGGSQFGNATYNLNVTGTVNWSFDVRQVVGTTGRVEVRNGDNGTVLQTTELNDNSATFQTITGSGNISTGSLQIIFYPHYADQLANELLIDDILITN